MLEIIVDFIDSYQLSRINRFIRKFKIDTIIEKIEKFGKSFDQLTKETVKTFLIDSKKSKFSI